MGTNAVQVDPLLDSHYHLTEDSPAIDAGISVQNPTDIDGDFRPDSSYDLEADEYYPELFLPIMADP